MREIYDLSKPDEMRGSVDPSVILPLERDEARLADFHATQMLVVGIDGEVVGFAGYRGNYISWLFVHPRYRRRGVATALASAILDKLNGEVELNLAATNDAARGLYTALAFRVKREFEGEFEGVPVRVVRMARYGRCTEATSPSANAAQIRPLEDSDSITDLTDLLHRAYKPLLDMGLRYWATHQTEADTRKRISGGTCLVAVKDGRVIGTVSYRRRASWDGSPWIERPEVATVGQFAVEPDLQKKGIGSALMFEVEKLAASEGATELALSTAEPATHLIAYYTKRGYRFIEHTDATLPQGYRSVILSKALERDDSA